MYSSSSSVYMIITRIQKPNQTLCIFQDTKEVQALGCNNGRDVQGLGVISPNIVMIAHVDRAHEIQIVVIMGIGSHKPLCITSMKF